MKTITKAIKILTLTVFLLLTKQNFSQCSANFNYNLVGLNGGVTFTSTSATPTTGTIYTWNYGNGAPTFSAFGTPGMTASTIYTANGTYTVTLNIYSAIPACTSSISAVISVTNSSGCGLNANFTSSQGSNGLVNFNNTSTGTVGGTTYTWTFGDGGTSNNTSPAHTYSANGTYVATLIANNNNTPTCSDTTTINVVVNTYCTLTAGFNFSYLANGVVAFFNTTSPSAGNSYTWTFINSSPASSNNTSPIITYTANGTYTVILSATSNTPACFSQTTAIITVTNATGCNLNALFSSTQSTNGAVQFNNTSIGTNSNTTYSWNFGNGQNSTLYSPSVTYSANGWYTVILVATTNGTPTCVSTKTTNIYINTYCNLNASFSYTTSSTGVVSFINTSPTGSTTPLTWNFGHSSSGNPGTSTVSAPNHTYPNGTYTVTLTIFTSSVCSSTATQVIVVNTNTCNLAASFSHTIGSNGLVAFANTSSGTNTNTTYTWNFGDGWTSNATNPSHTYLNGGTHYVSLSANNSSTPFCSDTIIQALNVTGIPCVANPNFTMVSTSTPQFWNAIPYYPYNVTAAQWSWGDGSTSNSLYSSHQYSAAANYTICLTVTVSCGSSASVCTNYYVSKSADATEGSGIIYVNVVEPENQLATGISKVEKVATQMSIYPNPNEGSFTISLNKQLEPNSEIRIYSLLGNLIYSESYPTSNDSKIKIELPQTEPGLYFVTIKNSTESMSQKIILK